MNWLKRNPLLGSVLLLLVALLVTGVWLWAREREQARRALVALEQKKLERDRLARQTPALSEANEQAIARDLANTRLVLAALRATLRAALPGPDETFPAPASPAKSIDLYSDIAAFVEKTRALATHAQVKIRPDEHFGFATHATGGPAADLIPAVFRQRIEGQYLLEGLLESRPRALLAVQREHPLSAAQRAQRNQPVQPGVPAFAIPAGNNGVAADFFDLDGRLSVRVPGYVDSDAFRLEFTGETATLRAFLNHLATFPLPVIVRSVEVEPMTVGIRVTDQVAPPSDAGTSVPLVSQSLSRWAVVVEFVVLPAAPQKPAS